MRTRRAVAELGLPAAVSSREMSRRARYHTSTAHAPAGPQRHRLAATSCLAMAARAAASPCHVACHPERSQHCKRADRQERGGVTPIGEGVGLIRRARRARYWCGTAALLVDRPAQQTSPAGSRSPPAGRRETSTSSACAVLVWYRDGPCRPTEPGEASTNSARAVLVWYRDGPCRRAPADVHPSGDARRARAQRARYWCGTAALLADRLDWGACFAARLASPPAERRETRGVRGAELRRLDVRTARARRARYWCGTATDPCRPTDPAKQPLPTSPADVRETHAEHELGVRGTGVVPPHSWPTDGGARFAARRVGSRVHLPKDAR
jgi:hypothetical protein